MKKGPDGRNVLMVAMSTLGLILAAQATWSPATARSTGQVGPPHRDDQSATPSTLASEPCVGQVSSRRLNSTAVQFTWYLFCNDGKNHDFYMAPVVNRGNQTHYFPNKSCIGTSGCSVSHRQDDPPGSQSWSALYDPASNGTQIGSTSGGSGTWFCYSGIQCNIGFYNW